MREFLFVDDMAMASLFVLDLDDDIYQENIEPTLSHINIGSGQDFSIKQVAEIIKDITNFKGRIEFDPSKPDGAPRKLTNINKLEKMGWKKSIDLKLGLKITYEWFLKQDVK